MDSTKRQSLYRVGDLRRTQDQVRVLLQITEAAENLLAKHHETGSTIEFDEAAAKSASETYCLAQTQLRHIIDDQTRWNLNSTEGDRVVERLAEANLKVVEQQKKNLLEFARPSRVYGARVGQFQLKDKSGFVWIAWLGGDAPTANGLCGVGPSAEAALAAFDVEFSKQLPPTQLGKAKPRTPKKKL